MSHRTARPSGAARPLEAVRAAWGAALLLAPRRVLDVVGETAPDRRAVVVVRVLGGRHLVQAAFSGLAPTRAVLACGTWVDVVHAATALALAAVDRPRARLALVDAAVAGTWALASRRDLDRAPAAGPDPAWTERLSAAVLPLLPLAPSAG